MVSTRSGKSTNGKAVTTAKVSKKSSKEVIIFTDSEFCQSKTISEEKKKAVFKINKSANRLSHNHIRFPIDPFRDVNTPTIHSSAKKHKFTDEAVIEEKEEERSHCGKNTFQSNSSKAISTPGSNKKLKVCMDSSLSPIKREIFPNNLTQTSSNPNNCESVTPAIRIQTDQHKSLSPANKLVNPVGIKKMRLNEEEKAMNGAPEGELYDVVLLTDSELPTLLPPHNQSISAFVREQIGVYFTLDKNGWAKQYEIITFLRQALLHHSEDLFNVEKEKESFPNEFQLMILKLFSDGITSLRSSNVRNALLGSNFLCTSTAASIKIDENIWSSKEFHELITQLLLKNGSNPKFLAVEAFQTLQKIITVTPLSYLLNPAAAITSTIFTEQYLLHRNPEISLAASSLLHEKIVSYVITLNQAEEILVMNKSFFKMIYQVFTLAKKFQSKEKMRSIFIHFKDVIFQENLNEFRIFLEKSSSLSSNDLSSSQVDEIMREVMKKDATPMATPSTSNNNKENDPSSLITSNKPLIKKPLSVTSGGGSISKPWLKSAQQKNNSISSEEPGKSKFSAMREQMRALQKKDTNQLNSILENESNINASNTEFTLCL